MDRFLGNFWSGCAWPKKEDFCGNLEYFVDFSTIQDSLPSEVRTQMAV